MTNPNRLSEAIDELVQSKTFSLDALNAIQDLKKRAATLENTLDVAIVEKRQVLDDRDTMKTARDEAQAMLSVWKQREAGLIARETKITELEKTAAVKDAVAHAVNNCFDKVFANRTLREQVLTSTPIAMPSGGGYVSSHSGSNTTERTKG